jgi:hypothetical protein
VLVVATDIELGEKPSGEGSDIDRARREGEME